MDLEVKNKIEELGHAVDKPPFDIAPLGIVELKDRPDGLLVTTVAIPDMFDDIETVVEVD